MTTMDANAGQSKGLLNQVLDRARHDIKVDGVRLTEEQEEYYRHELPGLSDRAISAILQSDANAARRRKQIEKWEKSGQGDWREDSILDEE